MYAGFLLSLNLLGLVVWLLNREVAGFDPDDRFLLNKREVFAHMGAAEPASRRVLPKLITERTGQYQYLFAAKVLVRQEAFTRRPLNQRGMFMFEAMQRHNF